LATVAVAVLSEWLVEGVKGVTAGLGWTPMFIGVILVALIGNAAEHASAVTVARRDQMDLSLAIALGSATQIALFVAPVLVLLGLVLQRPMDLLFDPFEVAGVAIAVALVNLVIHAGESTWLGPPAFTTTARPVRSSTASALGATPTGTVRRTAPSRALTMSTLPAPVGRPLVSVTPMLATRTRPRRASTASALGWPSAVIV